MESAESLQETMHQILLILPPSKNENRGKSVSRRLSQKQPRNASLFFMVRRSGKN